MYEEQICPICGKIFVPFAQHSLTDGKRHLVCSPACSTTAWKRNNERKIKAAEREAERIKRKNKLYRECHTKHEKEGAKVEKDGVKADKKFVVAKPVCIITKDGKIAKRFPSVSAASRYSGYAKETISAICRGKAPFADELCYTFKYDDSDCVVPLSPYSKSVAQYTLDGQFVARYKSVTEAAKAVKSSISNITQCCTGIQKTAKGFIFKYESEEKL